MTTTLLVTLLMGVFVKKVIWFILGLFLLSFLGNFLLSILVWIGLGIGALVQWIASLIKGKS